jgi:hypothetical protein
MKIALIEIGNSHDECLYSQIKIIKSSKDIHLTLIANKSLEESASYYDLVDCKKFVSLRKGIKQWIDLYKLWVYYKKEDFDKIIFNTAQGKETSRILRFPFGKKTKFYGTLHDTRKLNSSYSQKAISKKIDHYFILNEYLEKNIPSSAKKHLTFSVFHPIFFPTYPEVQVDKKEEEIWICVPGQVESKRRDYRALFDSIKQFDIDKKVKFVLLGRYGHAHGDGDRLLEQLTSLKVEDQFLIWEKFIPLDLFHAMIKNSDFVLPLIHPGDDSGDLYKGQISGAFNIAVGYKKPLLIEEGVSSDLNDYDMITYKKSELMKTINELVSDKSTLPFEQDKWTFSTQRKAYLQGLGIEVKD